MPLRYCVPTSLPWQLSVVGSCVPKKISRMSHGDEGGVKGEAHPLRVAGGAGADLLVAGAQRLAVAVAAFHVHDAAHAVEHRLGAPEAPPAEGDGGLWDHSGWPGGLVCSAHGFSVLGVRWVPGAGCQSLTRTSAGLSA